MTIDNIKLIEENKHLTQQLLKLQSELDIYSQEIYESSRHIGWLTQKLHNLEYASGDLKSNTQPPFQSERNTPGVKKNLINLMFLPILRLLSSIVRYAKRVLVAYDR